MCLSSSISVIASLFTEHTVIAIKLTNVYIHAQQLSFSLQLKEVY